MGGHGRNRRPDRKTCGPERHGRACEEAPVSSTRRPGSILLTWGLLFLALGVVVGPVSADCLQRGAIEFCAETDGFSVDVQGTSAVLDFGDVAVDDRRTFELTVTNRGRETVSVTRVDIDGTDSRAFSIDSGAFTLSSGQSRDVRISYVPQKSGNASAELRFAHGPRSGTIQLRGSGVVPPPELSVTPRSLPFPDTPVGQTSRRTLTLTNVGGSDLRITGIEVSDPGPFSIQGETPIRLAPDEAHELTVSYARTSGDPASTSIHIHSTDPVTPVRSVFVTSSSINATVDRHDGQTRRTVQTGEIAAGDTLPMNLPDDGAERVFELEEMTVRPTTDSRLSMTLTTSETALDTSPDFDLGDATTPVGWLSIEHSIPNDQIAEVTYTYRVETAALQEMGSAPEDVIFYRFDGTSWVPQETSVRRETDEYAVIRSAADAMSEWTAAAKRPRLNVTDSSVTLRTATTDEVVTIQVFVTNTGGTDGVYEAQLLLNGEPVEQRERTVPDGGTVAVSFERTFDSPGRYGVQVNDLFVGEVNISATNEEATVSTGDTPLSNRPGGPTGTIPILLVGGVIAVLAGAGLWYYLME